MNTTGTSNFCSADPCYTADIMGQLQYNYVISKSLFLMYKYKLTKLHEIQDIYHTLLIVLTYITVKFFVFYVFITRQTHKLVFLS
jgi:hypothetical protein